MKKFTLEDITAAQKEWGRQIVAIGNAYQEKRDYEAVAVNLLKELYAYDFSKVLFKPTKAREQQFRGGFNQALSYFVATNKACPEDGGFALAPWSNVRFENHQVVLEGDIALAMGNYFFTGPDQKEVQVEYTFGYLRDPEGALKICCHHSSLPFAG